MKRVIIILNQTLDTLRIPFNRSDIDKISAEIDDFYFFLYLLKEYHVILIGGYRKMVKIPVKA